MKLGLDAVVTLLDALGRPDRAFRALHVAGTNGKGSTCAFLAGILQKAGLRVGLYTSPHLVSITERIRLGEQEINESDFARIMTQVHDAVESLLNKGRLPTRPTFFEHLTATAFCYFAEQLPDIVVVEVGLGGRLDATNVLVPYASVISSIGDDHREWLGPTLAHIAREKAGIMKPGVPVYIADTQPEEARQTLVQVAGEKQCEPRWVPPFDIVRYDADGRPVIRFERDTSRLSGSPSASECHLALPGKHQAQNAALAAGVAQDYLRWVGLSEGAIETAVCDGLEQAHWPGRLQWIDGTPPILLDSAHNPQGAQAVAEFLETACRGRTITAVFAAMRDKPVIDLLSPVAPLAERLIVTEVTGQPRATPSDSLEVIALGYWLPSNVIRVPNILTALARARELTPPDGLIVVYGSIYLIGELLEILQRQGS